MSLYPVAVDSFVFRSEIIKSSHSENMTVTFAQERYKVRAVRTFPRRGGGLLYKAPYGEAPPRGLTLTLLYIISREKAPPPYAFHWKKVLLPHTYITGPYKKEFT